MKSGKLAVCLAGGVNSDGSLPTHAQKRVDRAVSLYKKGVINKILFSTGATHRGISKYIESEAMRANAIKQGVPADKVICEVMSRDTFGNAVFSRVLYIDPKRIKNFLVVTSAFHILKTRLLFDHVFPKEQGFLIKYIAASDKGLDKNVLKSRIAYEKYSCRFYKKEILSEIKPGDIRNLVIWHLENNPSHTLTKNEKFQNFERFIKKNFPGNPLY